MLCYEKVVLIAFDYLAEASVRGTLVEHVVLQAQKDWLLVDWCQQSLNFFEPLLLRPEAQMETTQQFDAKIVSISRRVEVLQ